MDRRELIKGIGVAIMAMRTPPFIPSLVTADELQDLDEPQDLGKVQLGVRCDRVGYQVFIDAGDYAPLTTDSDGRILVMSA